MINNYMTRRYKFMKRLLAAALPLLIAILLTAAALADLDPETTPEEYYTVGYAENTFEGLHRIMCNNLDTRNYPVPDSPSESGMYFNGDYELLTVLKDDDETLEYIGYVYDYHHEPKFIVRYWIGYHEDGELIGMIVYYMTDGKYLGNIQRDYTNALANTSSRAPYNVPGQGMHKLK